MSACDRCGGPAVIRLAYAGVRLCDGHFRAFARRRVRKSIRAQGPYPAGSTIAVAVSGGKDSVVALRLLHETLASRRDLRLVAVSVDEGIDGYRAHGLDVARGHAEALAVPWRVVSYRDEAGLTLDEVVARKTEGTPCAFCGPLRRRALNRAAREAGATHLATGHNLDDLAQSALMNALRGDVVRAARMPPHRAPVPGLVPRILPLMDLPEREVALLATLEGWAYHADECPYSAGATRGKYRDMLLRLEDDEPGLRHSLVRGAARVAEALRLAAPEGPGPSACATCGEPCASGAERCRGCEMLDALPA